MEEQKFPIYKFSARWSEDGIQDPQYPHWHKELPEGRIWNSTAFSKMFKEEKTQAWLDDYIREWWRGYLQSKEGLLGKNPTLDVLKAEYWEHETWVCTWFQHETFDIGQTDDEVLDSFERFVRRYENMQDRTFDTYPPNYHCLMGAEDRWRWHGAEPNGNPSDHSPAPCRCKYCKEQGLIRIAH